MICGHCKRNSNMTPAEVKMCYTHGPHVAHEAHSPFTPAALRVSQDAFTTADYENEARDLGSKFTVADEPESIYPVTSAVPSYKQLADLLPNIEHGHYAVRFNKEDETGMGVDQVWKFYAVDKPTEGKWAGYTFVKVCASDERYPIRPLAARTAVLQAIVEAGPLNALAAYGKQIGRCGVCSKTLTDPVSIANGIGPICAGRLAS